MISPMITIQKATILSVAHALLYVGVLYVREASRPSSSKTKDNPSVLKARFAAVAVACLLSVFGNRYVINQARQIGQRTGIGAWDDILGGWGEWKFDLKQTLHALELTALLFLGPLVERLWINGGWRHIASEAHWAITSVFGWRIFIIGPLSEEIVFRGCIIPLFLMARVQPLTIIFTAPLIFGLAHIHHAYEHHLHNPDQLLYTFIVTLVQFTYTSIFGWYASYLFLATKTVWAPAAVHTFCNVMGLPRFWGGIPGVSTWKMAVYYTSLVAGVVGFMRYIGSITPEGILS